MQANADGLGAITLKQWKNLHHIGALGNVVVIGKSLNCPALRCPQPHFTDFPSFTHRKQFTANENIIQVVA